MTTKLLVRQGGGSATEVDFANDFNPRKGAAFFDKNTPLLRMGQRWADGESAMGEFKVVDPNATLSSTGFRLRPWCEVRLTEDASGDELTLAWMRLSQGDVGRRGLYVPGDEIEHSPTLMDCNIDLRGIPFRTPFERPAETDLERLAALFERKLSGAASTAPNIFRETTDITFDSFANGHLAEHNTPVDLEAWDYPEGTEVYEVIAHIAEEAGKQWGVVLHHDGGSTHKCFLYVDNEDLDRWTTDVRISDDPADWDPDDPTAPTFEPHWLMGSGREIDFTDVISGLINIYGGTDDEPRTVYVETGEAPEDWETWVGVMQDDMAKTEGGATRHATHWLARRDRPIPSNQVSILVKAAQAHLVTAGMAIETKSVVMNSGPNKNDWVWRRVAECIVEPAADGLYWLHMHLENPRKAHAAGGTGGPGQPGSTSPKPAPECVEQEPDTETILSDSSIGDWGVTPVTDNACWDGDPHLDVGGTGISSDTVPVSPGDVIRGSINVRNMTGGDPWADTHSYNYRARLYLFGSGLPTLATDIMDERFFGDGCINVTRSADVTVPTGYSSARITLLSKLGRWRFNGTISSITFAEEPENDPDCLPAPTGTSPYYARSDDPRFDNDDQHLITALKGRVVNNSGGVLEAGDVVIADPSYTDGAAVTTTTDAAQSAQRVGVMTEGVAEDAVGVVLWEGLVRFPVNGASGAADLDYLYTSAVAGEAGTDATRSEGAVGQVIFDDANAPYIQWWGVPDSGNGTPPVTDHGDLTGLADDDHPQYYRTTDGGKDVINVVAAAGSSFALDLADGNFHDVTLSDDAAVGALAGATAGVACYFTMLVRQPSSGGPYTLTYDSSWVWVGGTAPVLETDADAWNLISGVTLDGGTTVFVDGGGGGSASLSDGTPLPISGSGDPGVDTEASRSDHVHPSTGLVGALLIADDATSPITFDDILQPDEGVGLLYADV